MPFERSDEHVEVRPAESCTVQCTCTCIAMCMVGLAGLDVTSTLPVICCTCRYERKTVWAASSVRFIERVPPVRASLFEVSFASPQSRLRRFSILHRPFSVTTFIKKYCESFVMSVQLHGSTWCLCAENAYTLISQCTSDFHCGRIS
jgi:hypothetical protein